MLGSSIDKPLMDSPLAGGQQTLGGPSFRQPGDMKRYVAFNDPGQPGAGFSNYQDYLAAGNKPVPMNLKTLEGVSNANFNTSPPGTLNVIDPNREARKKADEEFLKTADEFQRGFRESEFYKPGGPMTTDVAEFIYSSPTKGDITMKGSSSGISQFGKYLESIGKGNLLRRVGNELSQATGPLQPADPYSVNYGGGDVGPNVGYEPVPYNLDAGPKAIRTVDPIVTGPQEISTQQAPNQFNDQFSGFDQRGLPSILGINPMGQQSSFEQTFNDKQGLDRYVDDLVNERLRDIFGGIMGAINV